MLSIIEVLATFIRNMVDVDVTSPEHERHQSVNRESTEHEPNINRELTILGVAF
jgi:hypothetical protein